MTRTPRLLLAPLLLAGCATTSIQVHPAAEARAPLAAPSSYLEALDDLRPDAAAALAQSDEQRSYAAALEAFLRDDVPACERALDALSGTGDERLAGRAAELRKLAWFQAEAWCKLGASGAGQPDAAALSAAFADGERSRVVLAASHQEAPLTFSLAGIPTASFSVNGHAHELMMDTGATLSALADGVALESGVRASSDATAPAMVGSSGPGQAFGVRLGRIDALGLGALLGERVPVALFAQRDLQFRVLRVPVLTIEGIVGWNVLGRIDSTLDYVQARATFFPAADGDCERNLLWFGHPLAIAATPEGRRLLLGVDTGASRSYLTARGAAKLRPDRTPRPAERIASVTFLLDGQSVTFASLRVLENARAFAGLDGLLGNDLFSRGALTLRPRARCLHFRALR